MENELGPTTVQKLNSQQEVGHLGHVSPKQQPFDKGTTQPTKDLQFETPGTILGLIGLVISAYKNILIGVQKTYYKALLNKINTRKAVGISILQNGKENTMRSHGCH